MAATRKAIIIGGGIGGVAAALRNYETKRLGRARFIRTHSRLMGTLGQLNSRWLCGLRNGMVRWTPSWAALLWLSWQFEFEAAADGHEPLPPLRG